MSPRPHSAISAEAVSAAAAAAVGATKPTSASACRTANRSAARIYGERPRGGDGRRWCCISTAARSSAAASTRPQRGAAAGRRRRGGGVACLSARARSRSRSRSAMRRSNGSTSSASSWPARARAVYLAGEEAGGNLAAGVALMARDRGASAAGRPDPAVADARPLRRHPSLRKAHAGRAGNAAGPRGWQEFLQPAHERHASLRRAGRVAAAG